MKKFAEVKQKNEKGKSIAKWSDGFANSKNGKSDKKNKPKKTDDIEIPDNSIMLIDESVEVKSITGRVKFFAIRGASLKINGKKLI